MKKLLLAVLLIPCFMQARTDHSDPKHLEYHPGYAHKGCHECGQRIGRARVSSSGCCNSCVSCHSCGVCGTREFRNEPPRRVYGEKGF